ncbi:hypothetical protein JOF53_006504 [Crossiella equi]|uniref:Uncharacterized protein n=1 Tax=Crossiella equi TaxID=130796 RepID=A0ABS5AN15_9PSEU|nr:hypothetical protein [Crossiella equi]MBP2477632.1 hypothetical protein [Crossiella equi]
MMWPIKLAVAGSVHTAREVFQRGEEETRARLHADVVRLTLAMDAVLELHPVDGDGLCRACATQDRSLIGMLRSWLFGDDNAVLCRAWQAAHAELVREDHSPGRHRLTREPLTSAA